MLNKKEIEELVQKRQLISGYINLATQLTPNGFDLTAGEVFSFDSPGCIDFSNKERVVPSQKPVAPEKKNEQDEYGWWHLLPGAYKVKTNETVNLPGDLIAFAFSRTSLLRVGAFTQHGVWDAGFRGKGEFLLVVQNPKGLRLKQNARVAQLVFMGTNETEAYRGVYKDLN